MSGNTFGTLFTVSTAGESHGPGLIAVVDGCPPQIPLSVDDHKLIWIAESLGRVSTPRSVAKLMRSRFYLAFLRG